MRAKERKIAIYSAGLIIIVLVWLIVFTAELSGFQLIWSALLIVLSYIVMVFDINTKRIPNALIIIMIAGWWLMIMPALLFDTENGIRLLIDSFFGLLIGGGLFLLVYYVSRKNLGGGDVKFMSVAGLYLGFAETIPVILYGSVLAAITGVVLILLKIIGRKDTIPLAPFLFVGIMITIFT